MDALQFAYWLQGFCELGGDAPPTPEQWKSIREHLQLVFHKVTPSVGDPTKPAVVRPLSSPKWFEETNLPEIHRIARCSDKPSDVSSTAVAGDRPAAAVSFLRA